MPGKESICDDIDFSRLRRLRKIPVEYVTPEKVVLRCDLYERDPNTQNGEIRINHLAGNNSVLTSELQRKLAYLLEEDLLYEGLDDLEKALVVASSYVTARDVRDRMIRDGDLFLGVALWDCPEEIRSRSMEQLKFSLTTKVSFYDGNRLAVEPRDLSSTIFDAYDLERCSNYRESYPNSVFLFYDPNSILRSAEFRRRVYGLSLRELVPYKDLSPIPIL